MRAAGLSKRKMPRRKSTDKPGKQTDDRLSVAPLGEPYMDRLEIEKFLKDSSVPQEAASLLRAKLMEREDYRDKLLAELARKRGISFEQMRDDILTGKAQKLTKEEFIQMEEIRSQSSES